MKKALLVLIIVFLVTACSNDVVEVGIDEKVEDNKITYLDIKNNLSSKEKFNVLEDIPCDLKASVDRTSDEEISYRIILDNPKLNMHDVEALLIHNEFSENIFPSIGLFDDKASLLLDDEDVKGIELVGYIETVKELKDLNLELRLWLKYRDDEKKEHEIYYKIEDVKYHDNSTKKEDNK